MMISFNFIESNSQKIKHHYWQPDSENQAIVKTLATDKKVVVEIGPGTCPFALATEFIDWQPRPHLEGKPVYHLDLNSEPLPYADQSVDFIYCRHVLEDMYNPMWLCQEINRVAKAGYIETPSPIAECCRHVDGGSPNFRGYIHHRYLVWNDGDVLSFLPKYPVIEHLDFGEDETFLIETLNTGSLHWNIYFTWTGQFTTRLYQHDQDFKVQVNYDILIAQALETSYLANLDWATQHHLPITNS